MEKGATASTLPSLDTEAAFILSFNRVSPFVLAQPTVWYVLWLPPLPIVAVQSLSLTHRTSDRPATTCLFLACNCSGPQCSMMLTFFCALFFSFSISPPPLSPWLFIWWWIHLAVSLFSFFIPHFFLDWPFSFLTIFQKYCQVFDVEYIYIFLRYYYNCSKFDNHFFDISLSIHICLHFLL